MCCYQSSEQGIIKKYEMKTENIPFPVKWNKNWFRAKCILGNSWLNLLYFRWH